MAKVDLKAKLSGFKDDVLNKPVETPIQKVVPVTAANESKQLKKGSVQISAYIDEQLLEDVKIKLIKDKKKLSPLIEKLLTDWLNVQ